jgi:DNA-binding response OmpR family regulator
MTPTARGPILVTGVESETAEYLVVELRRLGRLTIWMDSWRSALEAIESINFEIVIMLVNQHSDWTACRALVAASEGPVVVATRFLAPDRRYRKRAFRCGVAAYMCPPFTRARLRQMIRRVESGDTKVELVVGSAFDQSRYV